MKDALIAVFVLFTIIPVWPVILYHVVKGIVNGVRGK